MWAFRRLLMSVRHRLRYRRLKGIFKDFSSGKGGSAVTFLMELEKFTYPEALKWLAKKYSIEVEETVEAAENQEEENHRESLMIVTGLCR